MPGLEALQRSTPARSPGLAACGRSHGAPQQDRQVRRPAASPPGRNRASEAAHNAREAIRPATFCIKSVPSRLGPVRQNRKCVSSPWKGACFLRGAAAFQWKCAPFQSRRTTFVPRPARLPSHPLHFQGTCPSFQFDCTNLKPVRTKPEHELAHFHCQYPCFDADRAGFDDGGGGLPSSAADSGLRACRQRRHARRRVCCPRRLRGGGRGDPSGAPARCGRAA